MSQTVLLTIGRLPKALDFARAFHHAGWRVVVAEPFTRHLTGVSRAVSKSLVVPAPKAGKRAYLEALAKIVVQEHVDLVLPLSEETMHVAHLRPLLPAHVALYAPEPEALLALHDKSAFIEMAQGFGLCVPQTALLGSDAARALAEAHDCVIKPVFSCSGRGVVHSAQGKLLPQTGTERLIVQRRVQGEAISTFAITHKGDIVCHVAYRGTVMSGSVAVAFERVHVPSIETWVSAFAKASRHSGFLSFDFIVDSNGTPYAIECNPRVTSGVHFVRNHDLAKAILAPESAQVELRAARPLMQFYPTLTEVQASVGRAAFWANLKAMVAARDVTWAMDDPVPFLTMPITAFGIIASALREKKSFGEVSTDDITWFEG